jgi:hypothetical protein
VRAEALGISITHQRTIAATSFFLGAGLLSLLRVLVQTGMTSSAVGNHLWYVLLGVVVTAGSFRETAKLARRLELSALYFGGPGWRQLARISLLMVVCGIGCGGLFFFCLFILGGAMKAAATPRGIDTSEWFRAVFLMPPVALILGSLAVGLGVVQYRRAARRFRVALSDSLSLCAGCSYPKDGLDSDRCPECGGWIRKEHAS